MKNETIEKDISMVKLLRDIRDKMNIEIADMSTAELRAYFKKRRVAFIANSKKEAPTRAKS